MSGPRISFGIIVLNGEPFTRYCLRALYPFAHEIIVVEGGHDRTGPVTTPDGHSTDGTLESLRRFQAEEDPEHKVTVVTRDGHWPMLDELGRCRTAQSQAYAERATGDYLWQVDIDEFYMPEAMARMIDLLGRETIDQASFMQRTFWASPDFWVDSWALRRGLVQCHRLFRWGPDFTYLTHQPPTVLDSDGVDLRSKRWLPGRATKRLGVEMLHYSLLFPKQVREKCLVYRDQHPSMMSDIVEWSETSYFELGRPYRVHNLYDSPSWLMRYRGDHPPQIRAMMEDVAAGRTEVDLRGTDDADRLVASVPYNAGIVGLRLGDHLDRAAHQARRAARRCKAAIGRTRRGSESAEGR